MSWTFVDEKLLELKQSERLEILKGVHEKVDYKDENRRLKFLRQIEPLINNWSSHLPDLREVFSVEELELLLSDAVQFRMIPCDPADVGKVFVQFVIRTGLRLSLDGPRALQNLRQIRCELPQSDLSLALARDWSTS
ncbi:hypothetical protein TKK_0017943 [Trichogramma kaykai]